MFKQHGSKLQLFHGQQNRALLGLVVCVCVCVCVCVYIYINHDILQSGWVTGYLKVTV